MAIYVLQELEDDCNLSMENHFKYAIKIIDNQFGEGFAKEHPELIGQLVQSASIEFRSITSYRSNKNKNKILENLSNYVEDISVAYKNIADSIEDKGPKRC